jgi:hypothetical protein
MDATTIPKEDRAKRTLLPRAFDLHALILGRAQTGLQAFQ